MKSLVTALALTMTLSTAALAQENTATSEKSAATSSSSLGKSALSVELLGRGLFYSANYDYNFIPNLAAGVGFGYMSATRNRIDASVSLVPVYANAYFLTGKHRPFVTAGVTFINATVSDDNETFRGSGNVVTLGGGYELRTEGGFIMRVAGYSVRGANEPLFWPGLSFGGNF